MAERAHQVAPEYRAHARRLDGAHSAAGSRAIENHLLSFGQVRALVFGYTGEASPDVHHLVSHVAECMARRQWRLLGARSMEEARSFMIARVRRRIGMTVVRDDASTHGTDCDACRLWECRGQRRYGWRRREHGSIIHISV